MLADVVAPITGVVWKILVNARDEVTVEQQLILIESMKMEVPVLSPGSGVVTTISVKVGDAVEEGDVLIKLESKKST